MHYKKSKDMNVGTYEKLHMRKYTNITYLFSVSGKVLKFIAKLIFIILMIVVIFSALITIAENFWIGFLYFMIGSIAVYLLCIVIYSLGHIFDQVDSILYNLKNK